MKNMKTNYQLVFTNETWNAEKVWRLNELLLDVLIESKGTVATIKCSPLFMSLLEGSCYTNASGHNGVVKWKRIGSSIDAMVDFNLDGYQFNVVENWNK